MKCLRIAVVGLILYAHQLLADQDTRWIASPHAWLHQDASSDSPINHHLWINAPVSLVEQTADWCKVNDAHDAHVSGFILCKNLSDSWLNAMQTFWIQPSVAGLMAAGDYLESQLSEEQQQAEYLSYDTYVLAQQNKLSADTEQELPEVESPDRPEVPLNRPANPDFDAMKKVIEKGVKADSDLTRHFTKIDQLNIDDIESNNRIADLLRLLIKSPSFSDIKPSLFLSAQDVLFAGWAMPYDDLATIAQADISATTIKPAYATVFRDVSLIGYWDIGELEINFSKPLSIYSFAKNGLVAKHQGRQFRPDNEDNYCQDTLYSLLPSDISRDKEYPKIKEPLVEIYSNKIIPPKINVRTQIQRISGYNNRADLVDVFVHQLDLNKDGIADILIAEGELPSNIYEGTIVPWKSYFINIQGHWHYAFHFVTPECT
jgi:hypothetical protein